MVARVECLEAELEAAREQHQAQADALGAQLGQAREVRASLQGHQIPPEETQQSCALLADFECACWSPLCFSACAMPGVVAVRHPHIALRIRWTMQAL